MKVGAWVCWAGEHSLGPAVLGERLGRRRRTIRAALAGSACCPARHSTYGQSATERPPARFCRLRACDVVWRGLVIAVVHRSTAATSTCHMLVGRPTPVSHGRSTSGPRLDPSAAQVRKWEMYEDAAHVQGVDTGAAGPETAVRDEVVPDGPGLTPSGERDLDGRAGARQLTSARTPKALPSNRQRRTAQRTGRLVSATAQRQPALRRNRDAV